MSTSGPRERGRVTAGSGLRLRSSPLDGETLSVHNVAQNVYSVLDVPDNFDDMVDDIKHLLRLSRIG